MTPLLLLVPLVLVWALSRRGPLPSGATVEPPSLIELAEARARVMLKLRRYEKERARRLKRYEEKWRQAPSGKGHGYILPFAAGGER